MQQNKGFYVIAHNIRSLYNIGSIFRTADAFKVSKIYLTGYTGTPANPVHKNKISKSALGAEEWVPWEYYKSPSQVLKLLKQQNKKTLVVGLENNVKAVNIQKFKAKFPLVLVLGEEVGGINRGLLRQCDKVIEIPMYGKKESLNVSVAFGISAYVLSGL